jgi:RNA polymerase sigma-70 factor (ECF subfamily)
VVYNENNSQLYPGGYWAFPVSNQEFVVSAAEIVQQQDVKSLYSDHHDWLQNWLRRKTGCGADAADLTHDVFIRILTRKYRIEAREPRAYLVTIARRLMIDLWRRRELERAWLDTLAKLPETDVPAPEHRLICFEMLLDIDRALDTLKPEVRSAFLMAQLDGATCPKIAETLKVSLSTAERYVAKGLRLCYDLQFAS